MKIVANMALKFVPRNMARLLVTLDNSETTIRVDEHIFAATNQVIIDDETMTIDSEGSSGSGWQEYTVTRGGSPTAHVGGAEIGANVLGPSPEVLLDHTFDGATEWAGIFIASPAEVVLCYEKASTREFYFQKAWGRPAETVGWPPYSTENQQVRILAWVHMPHAVSGALIG